MNQIIHEIEDSLRQERLAAWWKEYGPYLIAGCILAVLFTAFSATWRAHETRVNEIASAQIIQAENADDPSAALLRAGPVLKGQQRGLALLSAAGALVQKDDRAGAAEAYDAAIADKAIPEPFHSLAIVQRARLTGLDAKTDGKATIAQLQPIIGDSKNPWRYEARLTAALVAAHTLHDLKQARSLLAPITTDPAAAEGLKARAFALDHVYAVEEGS